MLSAVRQFFIKQTPVCTLPVTMSGNGCYVTYGEMSEDIKIKVREIDRRVGQFVSELARIHKSEVSQHGTFQLQQCSCTYYPDTDSVSVFFYGANFLAWKGARENFLKNNLALLAITKGE